MARKTLSHIFGAAAVSDCLGGAVLVIGHMVGGIFHVNLPGTRSVYKLAK